MPKTAERIGHGDSRDEFELMKETLNKAEKARSDQAYAETVTHLSDAGLDGNTPEEGLEKLISGDVPRVVGVEIEYTPIDEDIEVSNN